MNDKQRETLNLVLIVVLTTFFFQYITSGRSKEEEYPPMPLGAQLFEKPIEEEKSIYRLKAGDTTYEFGRHANLLRATTPNTVLWDRSTSNIVLCIDPEGAGSPTIINTATMVYRVEEYNDQTLLFVGIFNNEELRIRYRIQSDGTVRCEVTTSSLHQIELLFHHAPLVAKNTKHLPQQVWFQYTTPQGDYHWKKTKPAGEKMEEIEWVASHKSGHVVAVIIGKNDIKGVVADKPKAWASYMEDPDIVKTCGFSTILKTTQNKEGNRYVHFDLYAGVTTANTINALNKNHPNVHLDRLHYMGPRFIRPINCYITYPLLCLINDQVNNPVVALLIFILLLLLIFGYFDYRRHIISIRNEALAPFLEKLQARYTQTYDREMAKRQFYAQMRINQWSNFLLGTMQVIRGLLMFLGPFLLIPWGASHLFSGKSFLWIADLAGYDTTFSLPMALPVLGAHISLFAFLVIGADQLLSYLKLKKKRNVQAPNPEMEEMFTQMGKTMRYIGPILLFTILNNRIVSLSIYRFLSLILTTLQQYLFRLWVAEQPIKEKTIDQAKLAIKNMPTVSSNRAERRIHNS